MADNNTLTVPGIFDKLINTGADVPDLSKNIQGIPDYNYLGSNPVNLRMPSLGGSLPASSENNPVSQGIKDLFSKQPSFNTMAQSTEFNPEQVDVERYKSSPDFFKLGVSLSDNNEEKYGQNQSWSEVLGNGLTGMKNLAYNGFVDNVRGWGRMTDALVSWDWSKLKGDPMSMMELDNNMKKIMNDNPIYATEKGTETFWNRETFGNFLQQSGFTLGAIAEIVAEQAITKMIEGGLAASGIGAAGAGAMELAEEANTASKVGRLAKFFNKSKEFFDAAKNFKALKAAGDIWKSDSVVNAVLNGIGDISMQVAKRVPVVDLGLDIHRAGKAGATSLELAKIGVGGVKRLLSESNFAFTEARMEAAGTYTDLVNQMNADYYTRNGVYAQGTDLEKINEKAMKAADGNFNFNSAILFTSNRIMFDNLFKGSKATSKMLSAFGEELEDGSLKVFGKINNRPTVRLYEGAIKDFGKISSDFGRTKALTVAGKSIMANSLKFEAIEGIQELLQEGSNEYFKDYYMDAYKATYNPLISPDSEKSLDEAIASQKNMQGLKTFASGALTGMLIHGPTVLVTKSLQKASDKITTYNDTKNLSPEKKAEYLKNKEERKKAGEEFRNNFNALAKDPSKFFAEHVKNFNTQKEGSDALALAAKLGDKFAYENVRTDMMHNILMQAVANNTHEALVDTMRSYGQNMTKEEFEQAFVGMEYSSPNKKTAQDYVNKVADSIESYVNTREKLMDKYGHIANPNKFTFGSKLWFDETIKYKTLNNYIDILAGNEFKAANALQRSTDLFQKAAANKNLGSSLANAFQILGSERNMQQEMAVLKAELTNKKGQLDAATSADDKIAIQKEIDLKQDQLDALESWNTNKENMMDADKTTASYEAFKKYVDLKNKEAGKDQVVNLQDVEDHYLDFIDYIKLNRKAQDHTDAINFLINPENFKTLHDRLQNGAKDAYFDLLKDAGYDYIKNNSVNENEHFIIHSNGYYGVYSSKGELIIVVGSQENANNIKKQLDEALNKTDNSDKNLDESDEDFTDELISDFENKQAGKKETSTQSTELEDFMMAEYMAAKKAAEAQGKTIPDYEAWKKAAGKYVEQRFNRMKNSSSTPTTSSTETQPTKSNIEDREADIERRRQETNNKFEKFEQEISEIINDETNEREKLIQKLLKKYNVTLPENIRIVNWSAEELINGKWISLDIKQGRQEAFFGKENWENIVKAKKDFDIEFKKIEELNLEKINIIEQKQRDLLSTEDGLELRKAWSLGLIEEPNIVGLDSENFIEKQTEFVKGELVEKENYRGYYYLPNTKVDEDWTEYIEGKTKQEVIDKINAKYDAELEALEGVKPTEESDIETKKAELIKQLITPSSLQSSTTDKDELEKRAKGKQYVDAAIKAGQSDKIIKLINVAANGRSAATIAKETGFSEDAVRVIREYLGIPSAGGFGIAGMQSEDEQEDLDRFNTWKKSIDDINAKLAALENKKTGVEKSIRIANLEITQKVNSKGNIEREIKNLDNGKSLLNVITPEGKSMFFSLPNLNAAIDNQSQAVKEVIGDVDITKELAALEGKPIENETLTSVKLGKYTIEVGDLVNGKEVLSITPTHIIQDGIRNPITYSEMKSKLDTFDGNNITKKADIKPTSKVNVLENGQIDNPGETNNTLRKTASQSSKNIQEANPKLFGAGSPKVIPAASKVNNRSDNYEEVTKGNKTFRSRTDVNEKYPVFIATTAFGIGDALTLEVDYNIENFEGRDGIVQKEDFFIGNKIKESVKEEFPIAIYTVHNGEKVKIGYVPTVSWLQERWADDSTKNVVETLTDKDGNEINNLEIQTKELIKLRKKIFENHNKNPNFVQNAIVNNKSEGVLRVMETGKEKLLTNLNANDIQIGVIRNGNIQVSGTRSLSDEVGEESIIINIDELENKDGWPVVILPTPTGKRLVSYVSIPKLEEKDQDLVIESWKAFQKMQDDNYTPTKYELDLVKAIYSQLNVEYIDGEKPSFNILKDYFNSYITFQSGRRLDPTMNQGTSQMNITAEGGLFIWVRDNNDPEQVLEIKNVADLEKKDAVLRDKLSKLYYNVRLSENNSMGIGNQNTYSMITLERNADNSFRIKLNDMTYKQHLMNTLETNIDKGVPVDEKNPKSPWVYFANPVVTYDLSNSSTLEVSKKEVVSVEETEKATEGTSLINKSKLLAQENTEDGNDLFMLNDDELRDMFNECNPG